MSSNATDSRRVAADVRGRLEDTIREARNDVGKVNDPKAQALFETTAEVLQGLVKAYNDFERRSEAAWR